MSILEAMSYCKPVIATTVGGIPELIEHDVNGLLIEARDQISIPQSLIKLGLDIT